MKATDLNAVYLFISPPSMEILKARLSGRNTDTEEAIQKRMATAIKEIEFATSGAHDIVIINDDLERAYEKFEKVALGEEVQSDQLPNLLGSINDTGGPKPPSSSGGPGHLNGMYLISSGCTTPNFSARKSDYPNRMGFSIYAGHIHADFYRSRKQVERSPSAT